jgi:peptidoglycan hydrolase-like protein with peptidoglycan-binding domain
MSRNHTVLAASLVGVFGLVGLAQVTMSDGTPTGDPIADAAASEPVVTPAPTTAPPVAEPDESVTVASVDADCTLSIRLEVGMTDPEVACLETHLVAAGALTGVTPDEQFDAATEAAVETFQAANSLLVDGVVGPQTATRLGAWVGPDVLPPDPDTCAERGRSAVVDRFNQRAWLCEDGEVTEQMPITSAVSQPDPGTYEVYAKDRNASSTLTGEYSTMTHFVAFTYGKYQGARIAFHSVPKYANGDFVQPLDSVGSPEQYGDSSGCIRVLPDDAELIWEWLDIGDTVTVVT